MLFFELGWNIPQINYNSYLNLNFIKDTQIWSILEVGVLSWEVLEKMVIDKLTQIKFIMAKLGGEMIFFMICFVGCNETWIIVTKFSRFMILSFDFETHDVLKFRTSITPSKCNQMGHFLTTFWKIFPLKN